MKVLPANGAEQYGEVGILQRGTLLSVWRDAVSLQFSFAH